MKFQYCEQCKEDNERMALGYNPQGGNSCKHLMCTFLDCLYFLISLIFLIPLAIILILIIPIFWIRNVFFTGD